MNLGQETATNILEKPIKNMLHKRNLRNITIIFLKKKVTR